MARPVAAVALVVAACFLLAPAQATNHTVGGAAGWAFVSASNKAAADYASWASKQKFFLGDYLSTVSHLLHGGGFPGFPTTFRAFVF